MTSNENEPPVEESAKEAYEGAPGVETTMSDDAGSTFEPEEDPEGHDG